MNKIKRNNVRAHESDNTINYHIGEDGNILLFKPEHGELARVTNLFDDPLEKYRSNIFDAIEYIEDEQGKEFTRGELSALYSHCENLFDTCVAEVEAPELQGFIDNSLINDDYINIIENSR